MGYGALVAPKMNYSGFSISRKFIKMMYFVLLHLKFKSCTSRTRLQLVLEYLGVAEKEGARNDELSGAIW